VPGTITHERSEAVQEALWDRMAATPVPLWSTTHRRAAEKHTDLRWIRQSESGIHQLVHSYDRSRVVAAAQAILDREGWCVFEVCSDIPRQRWEPHVLIFDRVAGEVADVVEQEIACQPSYDARLTGCDRRTLRPDAGMGAYLCHVAEAPAPPAAMPTPASRRQVRGRSKMLVRDGMNPIVVTVGPGHSLREAARRMTAHGVGAAVVLDDGGHGPSIITERDILHSNGVGQNIDDEAVSDHLTSEVVYAAADWSLERAASEMVRGGFRHVIVVEGSSVAGILSMRDIVRCWTSDGATCAVPTR
jgi:CBS domain-containing protein